MFCQGQVLNLVNVVSAILVQLPRTVFHLICMTLLTLTRLKTAQELLLSVFIRDVFTAFLHVSKSVALQNFIVLYFIVF